MAEQEAVDIETAALWSNSEKKSGWIVGKPKLSPAE